MFWLLALNPVFALEEIQQETQESSFEQREAAFEIGISPKNYLSFGPTIGVSLSSDIGIFGGMDASFSRVRGNRSVGVSAMAFYDSHSKGSTVGLAPRFGYLFFAIDPGISLHHDRKEQTRLGGYLRSNLNLGFASLFYRVEIPVEKEARTAIHQLGISVLLPQELSSK